YISENAKVIKSFISEGAEVYGEVENTVVFQGVIIEEGSTVKNSVLMDGCVIGKNTILQDVIVCEKARIGSESRIGVGEFKESLIDKKVYNSNITVIGYNSVIPQGIIIGKNCVIDNYVTENDFSVKEVQSGEGIIKQI
nr:DapH/DapD/GlmU-related protein [Petrotogaceae bacterium]